MASVDAALQSLRAQILTRQALQIRGGGSKDFYGGAMKETAAGNILDTRDYRGILNYEPSELVITARCGTPLAEIKAALAERGQYLPFDPPEFAPTSTLGGAIASGLSGPRRASVGSLRDFVLGVTLMDGEGRILKFGGEVMKNVAGFDVSRLLAGSLGTLGVLLDISVKVLPVPVCSQTLALALDQTAALTAMARWAGNLAGPALPIAASCWYDGVLSVQLAGARSAVEMAQPSLAKVSRCDTAPESLWATLRDHQHPFFCHDGATTAPLWRLALPPTSPALNLGPTLIEWGGGQRWLRGSADHAAATSLRAAVQAHGGHATLFRGGDKAVGVFQPLTPGLLALHKALKQRFDPHGIFNPGRLYPEF